MNERNKSSALCCKRKWEKKFLEMFLYLDLHQKMTWSVFWAETHLLSRCRWKSVYQPTHKKHTQKCTKTDLNTENIQYHKNSQIHKNKNTQKTHINTQKHKRKQVSCGSRRHFYMRRLQTAGKWSLIKFLWNLNWHLENAPDADIIICHLREVSKTHFKSAVTLWLLNTSAFNIRIPLPVVLFSNQSVITSPSSALLPFILLTPFLPRASRKVYSWGSWTKTNLLQRGFRCTEPLSLQPRSQKHTNNRPKHSTNLCKHRSEYFPDSDQ